MCIKFTGKAIPIKKIREFIELELIDTDTLLISEEIQKLPTLFEESTSPVHPSLDTAA